MGTSPDRMRAEIEATRDQLSSDVDQLTRRASPRRAVRRRTNRVRGTAAGIRDRVMGTASYTAHGVSDTTSQAAHRASDTASQAAHRASDTAQSAAGSLQEGAGRAGRDGA
ncbi:DUF3618 domain-containing protein [Streptomyces sp. MJP52]|uniref:DUF3618 domain-containing protein n=1 Tax=Streptomyces sp. MJP52 TaxID=2940555 RepID=UPI00247704EF|nr:DUF3618 domain-containing protein [Streptomyces sp. MJP52]MDH6227264.1 hypothetical protein [Streptomyces sp. MJP52]